MTIFVLLFRLRLTLGQERALVVPLLHDACFAGHLPVIEFLLQSCRDSVPNLIVTPDVRATMVK
jgi:hypothetical protein